MASLKSLTLRDTDLPTRPGFGTGGMPVKLRTNFFPVRVPKGPLYEYDVAITPATAIKRIKRRIFQLAEQTPDWANAGMGGKVAHDHSSKLISSYTLPQPLVVKLLYTDEDEDEDKKREKEYALTIKFIQEIETQSLVKYVPSVRRGCATSRSAGVLEDLQYTGSSATWPVSRSLFCVALGRICADSAVQVTLTANGSTADTISSL